jgi:hypothetical protein
MQAEDCILSVFDIIMSDRPPQMNELVLESVF